MYTIRDADYNFRAHGVFSLFSFRLVECSYKGEVALISSTVYNITSDAIKFTYTSNICRLLIRLGLKMTRVFKQFLLINRYSVQLNITCTSVLSLTFYNNNKA